jgi:hypothetical protein
MDIDRGAYKVAFQYVDNQGDKKEWVLDIPYDLADLPKYIEEFLEPHRQKFNMKTRVDDKKRYEQVKNEMDRLLSKYPELAE